MIDYGQIKAGEGTCAISCIFNVLNYQGLRIGESETYILANGFNGTFNEGYVSLNTMREIKVALERIPGIKCRYLPKEKITRAIITKTLSKNKPIIMQMDSRYMSYDERMKKDYDFVRTFIITEYDEEDNTIYGYDTMHLDEEKKTSVIRFSMPISKILMKASELMILDLKKINSENILYDSLLREDIELFLGMKNKISQMTGIKAIDFQIKQIEKNLNEPNEKNLKETCYYVTNTIVFGTFVPMCTYLIDYFTSHNSEKKDEIERLKDMKIRWIIVANKAMKVMVTQRTNQIIQLIERYKNEVEDTIGFLNKLIA